MLIIVMHLYTWIALLMATTSVANSYSRGNGISDLNETYRDGKRLNGNPIVTRLTRNERCTEPEPESYNGGDITIYDCVNKICVFKSPTKQEKRMASNKKKRQRQKQGESPGEEYKAELCPNKDVVVQIKLEINMNLNLPSAPIGKCINARLEFIGANKGTKIPVLCGKVKDDMYIDIDNSNGPYQIVIKYDSNVNEKGSGNFFFKIKITFLTESKAIPYRCLQYKNKTTGTLKSFNYNSQPDDIPEPRYTSLINQRYSICFAYFEGYCDIQFEFDRFDIGEIEDVRTKDYLLIGDDKHYGDNDTYSVTVDASGPIIVNVRMDGNNTNKEEGFNGTYTMIKCPEPEGSGSSSNCPSITTSITTSEPLTTPNSLDFFWL